MMSENEFISLFEKYRAGKCSPEEMRYLEDFEDSFQLHEHPWTPEMGDRSHVWASLYERLKQEREIPAKLSKLSPRVWWSAAAAILIIGLTALGIYTIHHSGSAEEVALTEMRFETRNGEKKQITLQDGTMIHLNATSVLVLEKGFNKERRDVRLSGEAFFDVAHDKKVPFTVHTQDFNILVTGTAFNVKAYPGEKSSAATLIRGQISMERTGFKSKPVILKPGEKVTVLKTAAPAPGKIRPSAGDAELVSLTHYTQTFDSTIVETAWTQNRLSIYEQEFKDMKSTLERWFSVTITMRSKAVERYRFTATFTNESLEDILKALQKVQYFNYEIKEKTVMIW